MAMANVQAVVLWGAVAFAVYCALLLLARSARLVGRRRSRRRWEERIQHRPERHPSPPVFVSSPAALDTGPPPAGAQLDAVLGAEFSRRRVMNIGEYRVFQAVEQEVAANWGGYRVFSQTALGEVIESADREAHRAINSKRADVLVIDQGGFPVLAIEVHGKGHYRGDAAGRDAIKREALRRAGVGWLEIMDYHTEADVAGMVREALGRTVPARAQPAA
jgi:hypothetical protein